MDACGIVYTEKQLGALQKLLNALSKKIIEKLTPKKIETENKECQTKTKENFLCDEEITSVTNEKCEDSEHCSPFSQLCSCALDCVLNPGNLTKDAT